MEKRETTRTLLENAQSLALELSVRKISIFLSFRDIILPS